MIEAEWHSIKRAAALLAFVSGEGGWRKCTLFHVACCCSSIADWEDGHPIWDSISAIEACVDDPRIREDERDRLFESGRQARVRLWRLIQATGGIRTADVLDASNEVVPLLLLSATFEEGAEEMGHWWQWGGMTANGLMTEQIALTWGRLEQVCDENLVFLRDIFGNPFQHHCFSNAWRTDTVVSLSRQMYAERDFTAMPILADALQDAGCDNVDILDHCRGPDPHVRGCWVVDLVLGKE